VGNEWSRFKVEVGGLDRKDMEGFVRSRGMRWKDEFGVLSGGNVGRLEGLCQRDKLGAF